MPYVLTVKPTSEPLELDEAKIHMRLDDGYTIEDGSILRLITMAREYAEMRTQRALCPQQWRLTLDAFPGSLLGVQWGVGYSIPSHAILLQKSPVVSVQSITYLDTGGVWQTMDPTTYIVDTDAEPARITPLFGKIWPIPQPQIASVKVAFTAGYPTPEDVPAGIVNWMKVRVATIFENREEVALLNRGKIETLPYIDSLLDPYVVQKI